MFFTMGVLLKTNNMKISEVINKLQEVQKDWGDVEVMVYDYDAFHEADEYSFYVREGKLYIRG